MAPSSKSSSSDVGNASTTTSKKRKQAHVSPLLQQETSKATATTGSSAANENEKTKHQQQRQQKRKSKQAMQEEAEERRLTALLFGGDEDEDNNMEDSYNYNNSGSDPDLLQEEENEAPDDVEEDDGVDSSLVFEIDRTGHDDAAVAERPPPMKQVPQVTADKTENGNQESEDSSSDEDDPDDNDGNKPAWVDDDDNNVQVDLLQSDRLRKLRKNRSEDAPLSGHELENRLRTRYKRTMQATAQTDWARLEDAPRSSSDHEQEQEEDDEVAELQSSSQPLLMQGTGSTSRLPPNILNVMRCPDANQADYNKAVVQAVHFHPGSDPDRPLMLTAGLDKTLRFFQVGTEKSEKIHGIHFPKLPIFSASFLGDTGKVVVSGRRPFFYIYDSIAGKLDHVPRIMGREEKSLEKCFPSPDGKLIAFVGNDGYVILVDVLSKQWIANLKMNGSVRAITFTPDGEYIVASGSDGDVYRWDLRSRKCVERFSNQDGTITSYLAASPRHHLAVGSESGVVNLYNDDVRRPNNIQQQHQPRTPIKSIMNLQTSADMVRFNHDGQILAMSSRREKDAFKLLHVPTATVFSNWPTSKTPFNYVWSMDFSPQSKFLAVGNDKGKCLLYQLMHYSQD